MMKFEQNVWYKYSESMKSHVKNHGNDTGWAVVFACKNWDRHTDKFKISIIYDPYYIESDCEWKDNNSNLPVSNFGRIEYFMFVWKSKYEYDEFLKIVEPS